MNWFGKLPKYIVVTKQPSRTFNKNTTFLTNTLSLHRIKFLANPTIPDFQRKVIVHIHKFSWTLLLKSNYSPTRQQKIIHPIWRSSFIHWQTANGAQNKCTRVIISVTMFNTSKNALYADVYSGVNVTKHLGEQRSHKESWYAYTASSPLLFDFTSHYYTFNMYFIGLLSTIKSSLINKYFNPCLLIKCRYFDIQKWTSRWYCVIETLLSLVTSYFMLSGLFYIF